MVAWLVWNTFSFSWLAFYLAYFCTIKLPWYHCSCCFHLSMYWVCDLMFLYDHCCYDVVISLIVSFWVCIDLCTPRFELVCWLCYLLIATLSLRLSFLNQLPRATTSLILELVVCFWVFWEAQHTKLWFLILDCTSLLVQLAYFVFFYCLLKPYTEWISVESPSSQACILLSSGTQCLSSGLLESLTAYFHRLGFNLDPWSWVWTPQRSKRPLVGLFG